MAQLIESRFICDGRYRIHFINAVGRHRGRIIEIEDIDRRERFHGPASTLHRRLLNLLSQDDRDRWANRKRVAR
jgi:hypothetical protein